MARRIPLRSLALLLTPLALTAGCSDNNSRANVAPGAAASNTGVFQGTFLSTAGDLPVEVQTGPNSVSVSVFVLVDDDTGKPGVQKLEAPAVAPDDQGRFSVLFLDAGARFGDGEFDLRFDGQIGAHTVGGEVSIIAPATGQTVDKVAVILDRK